MRKCSTLMISVTCALFAGQSVAQTPAPATDPGAPAVVAPTTTTPAPPVPGANSFTEEQARKRIADQGFTEIGGMMKDASGIWRGDASRGGQKVKVSVDYQGNVVAQLRFLIPLHFAQGYLTMSTNVTGLFDTYTQAQRAVSDLKSAGFSSDDISIIANKNVTDTDAADDASTGAGVGAGVGAAAGLMTGLGLMAIPGAGPIVAAGWLVSTLAGGAAGAVIGGAAGGLVGMMTDKGLDDTDAHFYAEGVRRGSTVVSLRVDESRGEPATAILIEHGAVDRSERETAYRADGWERYDEEALPYTNEDIKRERDRYIGM